MRKRDRRCRESPRAETHVAILDIGMPVLNGFDATRQILRDNLNVNILITFNDSEEVIRTVLNAGARGFLLESDATRDLIAAVDALQHNRIYLTLASDRWLVGTRGRSIAR